MVDLVTLDFLMLDLVMLDFVMLDLVILDFVMLDLVMLDFVGDDRLLLFEGRELAPLVCPDRLELLILLMVLECLLELDALEVVVVVVLEVLLLLSTVIVLRMDWGMLKVAFAPSNDDVAQEVLVTVLPLTLVRTSS